MRFIKLAVMCLALIGAVVLATAAASPDRTTAGATVVNVIDGDTVVVVHDQAGDGSDAEVVRLLDVDSPERGECGWLQAMQHAQSTLLGARVRVEPGQPAHDQLGRALAFVHLGDRLVNADLAATGLGRPLRIGSDAQLHDQVAAAWTGPAQVLAGSCDAAADERLAPSAATALDQSEGLELDEHVRKAAQAAWREYEQARIWDLRRTVMALVPADASTVSTAEELLDDPATAKAADFDDEDAIRAQVKAAKGVHADLVVKAEALLRALRNPSRQDAADLGDERWRDIPASQLAAFAHEIEELTGRSERAVDDARAKLRDYKNLLSEAKARDKAKARARARAAALAHPVRVGTYNICKTTCGKGRHSWGKRRSALVNEVRRADPDVLAVQEANTATWRGTRQIDDVRRLLRPAGYEIASTRFTCTRNCTRGAHIFYKPSEMSPSTLPNRSMASAGMTSLATIAHRKFGRIQDRAVSWAFLTPKGSSRPTLYVSVHFVTEKTKLGESLRVATARRIDDFTRNLVARAGLKKAPIVVAGDFNSFARRQPRGAQAIMTSSGFRDGYSAPVKANADVGTVNYSPKLAKYKGFPPKPPRYDGSPTRIDYVFSTVAPLRHEVVVRLTKSGRFDDKYRASDHNMVMVDLPVR